VRFFLLANQGALSLPNHRRNKVWLSDGMPGLPRCPSQQQLDQQDSRHAVGLPPCLHGGRPDRAIAAFDATHDYPSDHVDDASEINTQNIAYLHVLDVTQSGLVMTSPSMLSASDGIDSELSSSASNAGTGPPPKAILIRPCACISCVEIGWFSHPMNYTYHGARNYQPSHYQCRYPGCPEKKHFIDIAEHERSHFRVDGQYPCKEEHCKLTTKRWSDLKRHSSSKHCTSLKKPFPCPVLWCKYSGDNGFARKDKLSSHFKTVHGGMSVPGKANRSIKPKVGDRA